MDSDIAPNVVRSIIVVAGFGSDRINSKIEPVPASYLVVDLNTAAGS